MPSITQLHFWVYIFWNEHSSRISNLRDSNEWRSHNQPQVYTQPVHRFCCTFEMITKRDNISSVSTVPGLPLNCTLSICHFWTWLQPGICNFTILTMSFLQLKKTKTRQFHTRLSSAWLCCTLSLVLRHSISTLGSHGCLDTHSSISDNTHKHDTQDKRTNCDQVVS